MKRLLVIAVVSVALLMTPVNVALALPPSVETQLWSGEYTLDCGDFLITDSWSGDVKITYYWNPDSSLDRYHIHGEFLDRMTNPINGKFVTGRTQGYNFFEALDAAPGRLAEAGARATAHALAIFLGARTGRESGQFVHVGSSKVRVARLTPCRPPPDGQPC